MPADCRVRYFGSAGNHLRAAAERLLDHLKEPKTKLGKSGKEKHLALHICIMSLAARDKELSASLLAVKWLGNVGSHSDELSEEDMFDAFDIFEAVLDDLFIRYRARLKKLVTSINKAKKSSQETRRSAYNSIVCRANVSVSTIVSSVTVSPCVH